VRGQPVTLQASQWQNKRFRLLNGLRIPGERKQKELRVGEAGEIAGTPLRAGSRRSLMQSDEISEWRDRRDSNPKSSSVQVVGNHELKDFTKEQWTQIWTHFSGEDRQMLTQIVERWGSLSEELKRAVIRVVG
jgi:hypothetical protein